MGTPRDNKGGSPLNPAIQPQPTTSKMKKTSCLKGLTGTLLLSLAPMILTAEHPLEIDSYTDASTCLQCHSDVDTELMATLHWTWEKTDDITGQEIGKINVINNYCIAVESNEPRCTSCHIGVGWADKSFDKTDASQIDCLVCHDQTGTYKKVPTGAGVADPSVNLLAVAQSSGLPTRKNCGDCHFYGGGGEGVKHGSMDSSLLNPARELDVHMGGAMDMQCTACHVPDSKTPHVISGSRYSQAQADHTTCQSCHTAEPHSSGTLNTHSDAVACQTCHIPQYARGGKATKMYWDWSTAGLKNPDGSPIVEKDADGNIIYDTKKGSFVWKENVVPEYMWSNGTVTHTLLDDTVIPGEIVAINKLHGDLNDEKARIFPVKRFRAIQPYDAGANTLAIPNLFPSPSATDVDAYWKAFDWEKALSSGMAYAGESYVGPVGFIRSEMVWIQNHMVAPKEQALSCRDCHTYGSRLNFAQLGYEPAKAQQLQLMMQSESWVNTGDWMGWINVDEEPWIYSADLQRYIYLPASNATQQGGWAYVPK